MNAQANTTIDKTTDRPWRDVEMVNEVTERLLKMKAVADLMLCVRAGDLAEDTMTNVGWLLVDMIDETKEIVCETKEVSA